MPTTFTGLLLFIVTLLPGYAYLVGKERHSVERRVSTFRETVSVVAASVTSELVALVLLAPAWATTLDVDEVIVNPGEHVISLILWGAGMLLLATIGSYVATWPRTRRGPSNWPLVGRPARWIASRRIVCWAKAKLDVQPHRYPHPSITSAWWRMFQEHRREIENEYGHDPAIRVSCYLDDGTFIAGSLYSHNQSGDDSPDRDLVLASPIDYRHPNSTEKITLDADVLCLTARHVTAIAVKYYLPPALALSPDIEEPESVGDGEGGEGG